MVDGEKKTGLKEKTISGRILRGVGDLLQFIDKPATDPQTVDAIDFLSATLATSSVLLACSHEHWWDILTATHSAALAVEPDRIVLPIAAWLMLHPSKWHIQSVVRFFNSFPGIEIRKVFRFEEFRHKRPEINKAVGKMSTKEMMAENAVYAQILLNAAKQPGSLIPVSPFGGTKQTTTPSTELVELINSTGIPIVWAATQRQGILPFYQVKMLADQPITDQIDGKQLAVLANDAFERMGVVRRG